MSADAPTAAQRAQQIGELVDRRRIALARDALHEALMSDPQHADLLYQAARVDALEDNNASARESLGRALASEPEHLGARMLLLWLLTDDGDLVQAEALALTLLREHPNWADLYAAYARVMLRALKFSKARELCREALRLDPANEAALHTMGLCDIIENPRGADSAAIRTLIAQSPDDRYTLGLVVAALTQAGKTREALRGARELLRLQPNDPHLLHNVRELAYVNHWSMAPLRPLQRFGWSASVGIWIGGIVLTRVLAGFQPGLAIVLGWCIFGYALYSWVWPPLLRRIMLRG